MNTWPLEFELPLAPEAVARWFYARDGKLGAVAAAGTPVPLPYLVFLRAQPRLGLSFHELLDRDPDRGLYGGVAYRRFAPLLAGQTLRASSEVTAREKVESAAGVLTVTTFTTTYRVGAAVHATEAVRMIDLPPGRPGPGPAQPARAPRHPRAGAVPPIRRSQVAWLTVETGDTNALHLDARYAASRGFPDVVVPATLLTALIERELGGTAGREVTALSVRYHAPTYPDEALELFATDGDGTTAFEAFAGDSLRASGQLTYGDSR